MSGKEKIKDKLGAPGNDNQTRQNAIDTILEKGVDFTITVQKQNILNKLHIRPNKKQFKIQPITMGTLFKISKIMLDMDVNGLTKALESKKSVNALSVGAENVIKNKDKLIRMIAYGVTNKEKDPPGRLLKFLNDNLTTKEALRLMTLIVGQMNINPFLASLISLKGVNLLEETKPRAITPGGSSAG